VNVYVDTSVMLRIVLREGGALSTLRDFDQFVSSELTVTEGARAIDRLRLQGALTTEEAFARAAAIGQWLESVDLVLLRTPILERAAHPLPTPLGTLDAIHLATALTWRDRTASPLVMATHDGALAIAAGAFGFEVIGA
jgi:predicted nucleic acid-binding protein